MDQVNGRVISVLEGGYDTESSTLGLARCVDEHVRALRRITPRGTVVSSTVSSSSSSSTAICSTSISSNSTSGDDSD